MYEVTFLISKASLVTVKHYMLHIPFVKICPPPLFFLILSLLAFQVCSFFPFFSAAAHKQTSLPYPDNARPWT